MRNGNEYIAVELQPKTSFFAIFRRFNGHKAVESGDNQFVSRVELDQYHHPGTQNGRYMEILSVGPPLSASLWSSGPTGLPPYVARARVARPTPGGQRGARAWPEKPKGNERKRKSLARNSRHALQACQWASCPARCWQRQRREAHRLVAQARTCFFSQTQPVVSFFCRLLQSAPAAQVRQRLWIS